MASDADRPSEFVRPRPGVLKALGIVNVVFAVMILIGLFMQGMMLYGVIMTGPVAGAPGSGPSANPSGSFLFGMNEPGFLRFTMVDAITGLVLNLVMLASGIGLINLRRWAARLWAWTAWIKIARLLVLWGFFYIVVVTPSFSEHLARGVLAMMNPRLGTRGAPTIGQLTRAYAIMNLLMGVGMVLFGSAYPVLSLWLLGRPGVKAALGSQPFTEPELK